MTDEQIEKASAAYVLERQLVRHNAKKAEDATMSDFDKTRKVWDAYDMMQAYGAGMRDALSLQWVRVEERMPEYNTTCLVFGHHDFGDGSLARYTMMAHYDGENFYDVYDDRKYHPEMWMPIPVIPQLNPEK